MLSADVKPYWSSLNKQASKRKKNGRKELTGMDARMKLKFGFLQKTASTHTTMKRLIPSTYAITKNQIQSTQKKQETIKINAKETRDYENWNLEDKNRVKHRIRRCRDQQLIVLALLSCGELPRPLYTLSYQEVKQRFFSIYPPPVKQRFFLSTHLHAHGCDGA
jgi:hypothetical protein